MLWLSSPPWARWLGATLILLVALWVELRPEKLVDHPFASVPIPPGQVIGPENTEMRRIPASVLEPPRLGGIATREVTAGSPILSADMTPGSSGVPPGWWVMAIDLPPGAAAGQPARIVLIDEGLVIDAVVAATAAIDPLLGPVGAVAVPDEHAGRAAAAAANGRVTVMLAGG